MKETGKLLPVGWNYWSDGETLTDSFFEEEDSGGNDGS